MKPKVLFVKTHPDAKVPTKAYPGDAGYDLYAVEDTVVEANVPTVINVGLRLALPDGYYAEIHTRSSQGLKGIRNHLGIIDSGYRGDVSPIMISPTTILVKKGDKVAQLVIRRVEDVEFVETDTLPPSTRGVRGFGSSGR